MDSFALIKSVEVAQIKKNVADVRPGDSVKVHYKIREGNKERTQIFEGLVIATKGGKGIAGSFTVRKVVSGIGVERTFPLHSPWMLKVERTKTGKIRRAKLNFVRRYATSSRFKLKDKGKAGTTWEEIAEQQAQVEQSAQDQTVKEDAEESVAPEVVEESQEKALDNSNESTTETDGSTDTESVKKEEPEIPQA